MEFASDRPPEGSGSQRVTKVRPPASFPQAVIQHVLSVSSVRSSYTLTTTGLTQGQTHEMDGGMGASAKEPTQLRWGPAVSVLARADGKASMEAGGRPLEGHRRQESYVQKATGRVLHSCEPSC